MQYLPLLKAAGLACALVVGLAGCESKSGDMSPIKLTNNTSGKTAEYRVKFVSNWTQQAFPTNFPNDPHFSPLVVVTHSEQTNIWGPNVKSSKGVEQVAESGGTSIIKAEIKEKEQEGKIGNSVIGGGRVENTDTVTLNVTASKGFPRLSVLTMLAPSPDWILGVHDLDLLVGGKWVESKTINLKVYDAGTDIGARFTSANANDSSGSVTTLSSAREDTDFKDGVHHESGAYVAKLVITKTGEGN